MAINYNFQVSLSFCVLNKLIHKMEIYVYLLLLLSEFKICEYTLIFHRSGALDISVCLYIFQDNGTIVAA